MARVAIAYVEVRPDLGTGSDSFAARLKAALAKVNITEKVKITPDTKGFGGKVAAAVRGSKREGKEEADALGELIGEEASKHMMSGWDVDTRRLLAPLGDVGDSMNTLMDLIGDDASEAFARSIQRRLTGRVVKAMSARFDQVEEEEKIQARALALTFLETYQATLGKRSEDIGHGEAADLKKRMLREFGPMGATVAEAWVKSFNRGLAAERAANQAAAEKLAADIEKAHSAALKEELLRTENHHRLREAIEKAHGQALVEDAKRTAKAIADEAAKGAQIMENLTKKLGGKTARVARRQGADAGKQFADSFANQMRLGVNLRLGQLLPIIVSIAFAAAPLAGLLSSLAAGASALAVALGEAAAAAGGALAAGLLSLAQAAGVAKLATTGLADALKAQDAIQRKVAAGVKITQTELDKYNQSMAQLSPAARDVVTALGRANSMVASMRRNLQQRLFAGVGAEIGRLAKTYLPLANAEFGRTADVLNRAGLQVGRFLRQAQTIRTVRDIMAGNTAIAERFTHALIPLASAALRLLKAIQPLGMQLAGYVTQWAKAVDQSTAAAQSSGRLTSIVRNLQKALDQAVRIIVNVYRASAATFKGLLGPGRTLLSMFERLTARWADWTRSVVGQNAIRDWGEKAIPVMHEMGGLIGDLFRAFNRLAKVGDPGGFLASLRGIVGPLEEFLAQLSASGAAERFAHAMGELLSTLVEINAGGSLASITSTAAQLLSLINTLVNNVPFLSTLLWGLARVLSFIAAIKFVSALTGLNKLPQYAIYVRDFTKALLGMKVAEEVTETFAFKLGDRMRYAGVNAAIAGDQMRTAAGRANLLKTATGGITGMLAANPFGVATVALGAFALGFWGVVKAAKAASGEIDTFSREVSTKIGGATGQDIQEAVDGLKNKLDKLKRFGNPFGDNWERDIKETQRQLDELQGASRRLTEQYGSDVNEMVAKVRELGVGTEVSTQDIIVAMERTRTASGNTKLSIYQLAKDTAANFGAMKGNLSDYVNSTVWGKLTENIERQKYNGRTWAEEHARGIQMMVTNMETLYQAAYNTASGMADVNKTNQLQYEKQLGKIHQAQQKVQKYVAQQSTPGGGGGGGGVPDYSGYVTSTATKSGQTAGRKTAAGFITTFTAALKDLKPTDLLAHSAAWTKVGLNISKYIASGITSGSKNIAKVGAYINKKFGASIRKIQAQIDAYRKAATPFVKELSKNMNMADLTTLLDKIKDFKAQAFETLTSGRSLTGLFGFIPTPAEVQQQLDRQLAQFRDFTTGLASLQALGLDKNLAKEWLMAGPEQAGNLVKGLAQATPEEIAAINKTYQTIGTEAKTVADTQATKFFGVGQSTVQGYINGIKDQQAAAVKSMNDLMDAVIKAANKKLGNKSPSKVFGTAGTNTVAGYIGGVRSKQDATVAAIRNLYDKVSAVEPAKLRAPDIPKPGYASAASLARSGVEVPPAFDVKVFVGNQEIKDMVRVETVRLDEARARSLYAGRRGG